MFTQAVNDSCCCSLSSLVFDVINILDFCNSNRCISVLICSYITMYNIEHLFVCFDEVSPDIFLPLLILEVSFKDLFICLRVFAGRVREQSFISPMTAAASVGSV